MQNLTTVTDLRNIVLTYPSPLEICKCFSMSLAILSEDSSRSMKCRGMTFPTMCPPHLEHQHQWKVSWEIDVFCPQFGHLSPLYPSVACDIKNEAEGSGGLDDNVLFLTDVLMVTTQFPLHNPVNWVYRGSNVLRVCEKLGKYCYPCKRLEHGLSCRELCTWEC